MSKAPEKCDYGCSYVNIDEQCANCGSAKHLHSPIHPHKYVGSMLVSAETDEIRPITYCDAFTSIIYTKRP